MEINSEQKVFIDACAEGNFEMVQQLLKENTNISVNTQEIGFQKAWCNNHKNLAMWLVKNNHEINMLFDNNALEYSCKKGIIEDVEFLLNYKEDTTLSSWKKAFEIACESRQINLAKYIIGQRCVDIKYGHIFIKTFISACEFGHLDIVEWLVQVNPSIKQNIKSFQIAFRVACTFGHKEIAEFLLTTNSNLRISSYFYGAFECACDNSHILIARWLYSLKPNIVDDYFNNVCKRNNLKRASLIRELNPIKYSMQIENNTIVNWKIINNYNLPLFTILYSLQDNKIDIESVLSLREYL